MPIENVWPDQRSAGTARALNNIALSRLSPGKIPENGSELISVTIPNKNFSNNFSDGKYLLLFRAATAAQGHWHRLAEKVVRELRQEQDNSTDQQVAMLAMWHQQQNPKSPVNFWVIPLAVIEQMDKMLPSDDNTHLRNVTIDPQENLWFQSNNRNNSIDLTQYAGKWELNEEEKKHILEMERQAKKKPEPPGPPGPRKPQGPEEPEIEKKYALNTIFYGPPGTGKTYSVFERAVQIADPDFNFTTHDELMKKYEVLRNDGRIRFVTFHQSYSYEEFIEGLRPKLSETGSNQIQYEISPGVLRKIVTESQSNKALNYVLVIDEINRGNISKIFGELITLLDSDKRLGGDIPTTVTLPYSRQDFGLPSNLYILGTMNTADRSIALMDMAIRRRFEFEEIMPDSVVIQDVLANNNVPEELIQIVVNVFEVLNRRIEVLLDRDHQIGHSYFLEVEDESSLLKVWNYKILPLLQEYFYNDWDQLKMLLGKSFVKDISNATKNLFAGGDSSLDFPSKIVIYEVEKQFIEALEESFPQQ